MTGMVEDRSRELLATNVIFLFTTWITFGLRIYLRAVRLRKLERDDYLMIAAQLLFTAYLVSQLISIVYGNGKGIELLTVDQNATARKYWWLCGLLYEPATVFVKLSAGAFILKFTRNRFHRALLWFTAIACIIVGIAYWFILVFQCRPISYWWTIDYPESHGVCISSEFFLISGQCAASLNAAADLVYTILPFHIVWHASWRTSTKIQVCALLGWGSIAGVATIVRIGYAETIAGLYEKGDDMLWKAAPLAILSTLEVGFGITAACVVTLRPLFERSNRGMPARARLQSTQPAPQPKPPKIGILPSAGFTSMMTGHESLFEVEQMPDLVVLGEDDGTRESSVESGNKKPLGEFEVEDATLIVHTVYPK